MMPFGEDNTTSLPPIATRRAISEIDAAWRDGGLEDAAATYHLRKNNNNDIRIIIIQKYAQLRISVFALDWEFCICARLGRAQLGIDRSD